MQIINFTYSYLISYIHIHIYVGMFILRMVVVTIKYLFINNTQMLFLLFV